MEEIHGQTFEDQDYTVSALKSKEYDSCVFRNCNFLGADLSGINFIESEFIECNLSNVKIENTALQKVIFKGCKMMGLQYDTIKTFGFEVIFEDSILSHSVFYQTNLSRSTFTDCMLHDVDYTEANMQNTILQKCDLLNAKFDRTNLEKADLRNARNYSIDPEANLIRGAQFSLPEVLTLLDKYRLEIE